MNDKKIHLALIASLSLEHFAMKKIDAIFMLQILKQNLEN